MNLDQLIPNHSLVKWKSQSGGHSTTKEGKVLAHIPAGDSIRALFPTLSGTSGHRIPQSRLKFEVDRSRVRRYLVAVPRPGGDPDYYAPPAQTLEAQNPTSEIIPEKPTPVGQDLLARRLLATHLVEIYGVPAEVAVQRATEANPAVLREVWYPKAQAFYKTGPSHLRLLAPDSPTP